MSALVDGFLRLHAALAARWSATCAEVRDAAPGAAEAHLEKQVSERIRQDPLLYRWLALEGELTALFAPPPPEATVRTPRTAPPDVPIEDVARWAAAQIEAARVPLAPLATDDLAAGVRWLATFAQALQTARARGQMARVPQPVFEALLGARTGHLAPGTTPTLVAKATLPREPFRDRTGKTFAASAPDLCHWRLRPARGLPLVLPFEADVALGHREAGRHPRVGPAARQVLTGGRMKLYTATWLLWDEARQGSRLADDHGLFRWSPSHVLLDIYGAKPVYTTAKGRRYARPSPRIEKALREDFALLRETYLLGIGPLSTDPAQALIYQIHQEERGEEVYHHATLALMAMKSQFIQVPVAVLRLLPADVPLALGFCNLWRVHIVPSIFRGAGHYRTTLHQLAEQVGEDPSAGARRDGRTYWTGLAEQVRSVVQHGDLGTIAISGEGPTATVTLEPSDALAAVYRSLLDAQQRQQDRAAGVEHDAAVLAEVTRLTGGKRKPGRPRKHR